MEGTATMCRQANHMCQFINYALHSPEAGNAKYDGHCKVVESRFRISSQEQIGISKPGRELTSLGSIVQKGKFSAGIEHFVRVLYSVDFPTLGIPTIPTCSGTCIRQTGRARASGGA